MFSKIILVLALFFTSVSGFGRSGECSLLFQSVGYMRLVEGEYQKRLEAMEPSPRQYREELYEDIPFIASLVDSFSHRMQESFWELAGVNRKFFEALMDTEAIYSTLVIEHKMKMDALTPEQEFEVFQQLMNATYLESHPLNSKENRFAEHPSVVDLNLQKKVAAHEDYFMNNEFGMASESMATKYLTVALETAINLYRAQFKKPPFKKNPIAEVLEIEYEGTYLTSSQRPEHLLEPWVVLEHFVFVKEVLQIGLLENPEFRRRPDGEYIPILYRNSEWEKRDMLPEYADADLLRLSEKIRRYADEKPVTTIYDAVDAISEHGLFISGAQFKELRKAILEIMEKGEVVNVDPYSHLYDQLGQSYWYPVEVGADPQ